MSREVRLKLELEDYRCKPRIVDVVLIEALWRDGCQTWPEHRGKKLRAYEVYEVLPRGRVLVGRVTEETETLERRTPGRMYVNRRWTGAKTVWAPFSVTLRRESRRPRQTRQDAIAVLFGMNRARRAK